MFHCVNPHQVADVYDGIYSGLRRPDSTEDNQCGIVVEQASNVNNGRWTCTIYNTQYGAFVGSKNLVITGKNSKKNIDKE